MDESPKQLIGEKKNPIEAKPGSIEKYDYEYVRNGVCNIFMCNEPLSGKRFVKVTEKKNKKTGQISLKKYQTNTLMQKKLR